MRRKKGVKVQRERGGGGEGKDLDEAEHDVQGSFLQRRENLISSATPGVLAPSPRPDVCRGADKGPYPKLSAAFMVWGWGSESRVSQLETGIGVQSPGFRD